MPVGTRTTCAAINSELAIIHLRDEMRGGERALWVQAVLQRDTQRLTRTHESRSFRYCALNCLSWFSNPSSCVKASCAASLACLVGGASALSTTPSKCDSDALT